MALTIKTERLNLRLRDERDADWYRELVAERGEDLPTLADARARPQPPVSTVRSWNTPSLKALERVGSRRDRVVVDDRGEVIYLVRELAA